MTNPRIKQGWDYFWNLKPSDSNRIKNVVLIAQLHYWQKMIIDDMKSPQDKLSLDDFAKEIFK